MLSQVHHVGRPFMHNKCYDSCKHATLHSVRSEFAYVFHPAPPPALPNVVVVCKLQCIYSQSQQQQQQMEMAFSKSRTYFTPTQSEQVVIAGLPLDWLAGQEKSPPETV